MVLSTALKSNDLNALIQLAKENPTWDTVYNISVALHHPSHHLSFEHPSEIDDNQSKLALQSYQIYMSVSTLPEASTTFNVHKLPVMTHSIYCAVTSRQSLSDMAKGSV